MNRVRNTIRKSITDQIPETVSDRRKFLKKHLAEYIGESVYCPALGVNVDILSKSVEETAQNAALSKESTIAALNLKKIIQNAVFEKMDIPKSNKQKKNFSYIFVYKLKTILKSIGTVSLVVGVRDMDRFLHYSITIPLKVKKTVED